MDQRSSEEVYGASTGQDLVENYRAYVAEAEGRYFNPKITDDIVENYRSYKNSDADHYDFAPYKSARFKKAWKEASNLTLNVATLAQAANPDLAKYWGNAPIEPDEFRNFERMTFEQRRKWIKELERQELDKEYGWVPDRGFGMPELTGLGLKTLADPVALAIPFMPYVKGARAASMIASGAFVATDVAIHNMANEGEIDLGDVVIGSTIGAMLPPAFAAGKNLIRYLRGSVDNVTPATEKGVKNAIDMDQALIEIGADIPVVKGPTFKDYETFTKQFNESFELTDWNRANKKDIEAKMRQYGELSPETSIAVNLHIEGGDVPAELAQEFKAVIGDGWIDIKPPAPDSDVFRLANNLVTETAVNPKGASAELAIKALKEAEKSGPLRQTTIRELRNFLDGFETWKGMQESGTDLVPKGREGVLSEYLKLKYDPGFWRKAAKMPKDENKFAEAKALQAYKMNEDASLFDFKARKGKNGKYISNTLKDLNRIYPDKYPLGVAFDTSIETVWKGVVRNRDVPWSSEAGREISPGAYGGDDVPAWEEAYKLAENAATISETEFQRLTKAVKHKVQKYVTGRVFAAPIARFENLGLPGKLFSRLMTTADARSDQLFADYVGRLESAFRNNGLRYNYKNLTLLKDLLRKTLPRERVSGNLARLHDEVRGIFNDVVDKSIKAKVFTPEEGAALKAHAAQFGYFPRVYDQLYLQSGRGQKRFKQALLDAEFGSPETVKRVLEALSGEKKYPNLVTIMRKMDNGRYKLTPALVEDILARQDFLESMADITRSRHLERVRKIPEELEEILTEFLIDDPEQALRKYFHDVATRIEYSNTFGAKDEAMKKLQGDMGKLFGDKVMEDMWDTYFERVGDPHARNVQAHARMSQHMKGFNRKTAALQNLKLGIAAPLSVAQAFINPAAVATSKVGGAVPLWRVLYGQLKAGMKGFGGLAPVDTRIYQETWGKRLGAVSESMSMTVGSHTSLNTHSLANRRLFGIPNPLSIFANPTKFLTYTGFIAADRYSRIVSHNLADDLIRHMLTKKHQILSLKPMGRFTAKHEKQLKRLNDALNNFHVRTDIDPLDVPVNQIERGATLLSKEWEDAVNIGAIAFSKETQFTTRPGRVPEIFNNPNFKFFLMFKSFSFHQGKLIKDHVILPLVERKDPRPLIAYATMLGAVGVPIYNLRQILKGDDEDYTWTEQYLNAAINVGGIGLGFDIAKQAAHGPLAVPAAIGGPNLGTAGNMAHGIYKAFEKGELEPAIKAAKKELGPLYKILEEQILEE